MVIVLMRKNKPEPSMHRIMKIHRRLLRQQAVMVTTLAALVTS